MFTNMTQKAEYDWVDIGPVPYEEERVQVDPKIDYLPAMTAELKKFKVLLESTFPIPAGVHAHFRIKWETHEFGRYGLVVVMYDVDETKALDFALMVEEKCPARWPAAPSARFQELINEAYVESRSK